MALYAVDVPWIQCIPKLPPLDAGDEDRESQRATDRNGGREVHSIGSSLRHSELQSALSFHLAVAAAASATQRYTGTGKEGKEVGWPASRPTACASVEARGSSLYGFELSLGERERERERPGERVGSRS